MDFSDFIVMLARQRSGTNPLRSVLDAHPDIFCTPEVFHPEPSPDAHLEVETNYFGFLEAHGEGALKRDMAGLLPEQESLFSEYLGFLRCFSDKRYILLDVKYNTARSFDPPWWHLSEEPALFELIRRHKLRVLNLTRRNHLRYVVSDRKATLTGQWTLYDESVVGREPWYESPGSAPASALVSADTSVTLPPDGLLYNLKLFHSESEMVRNSFAGYESALTIEYQDLFPELGAPPSDEQLGRLATWLGVQHNFPKRPKFRKQAVRPLRESIANYDQVAAALRHTPFQSFLEDERMYGTELTHAE